MKEDFKINIFYSDNGENLENILSRYLINLLKERKKDK